MFFKGKHSADEPQLHALIIGVDYYPYLGPIQARARKLPPLQNLHSPSRSANAIADWLRTHESWLNGTKLGSVDLIVSTVPDDSDTLEKPPAPKASTEIIATAFDAWFERCNENPNNVALFYFCGHGLEKDAMLLLPEDFGSIKSAPWMHAIDFDATYRGMACCAAKTQYFVIDACRQWSPVMLEDLTTGGVPLCRANIRQQKPRTAPKLYGTAPGLPAFGDTSGKPSRLAQALLDCLEGKAAVKASGRWRVNVDRLGMAVQSLVDLRNRALPERERQLIDPVIGEFAAGNHTLVVLPHGVHPLALVEFDCDPNEATEDACFYHQGISPAAPKCDADRRGAWSIEVLAGIYHCGANHPLGSGHLEDEVIHPPVRSVRVKVA